MSSRYQILTTLGWDRTSVKNFNLLSAAQVHYEKLKEEHRNDIGFREYDAGKGFISSCIDCQLIDTGEPSSDPTGFSGIGDADLRPLIYLASPYTHNDPKIVEERWKLASKKAAELINKGELIFSPIAMAHPMAMFGSLPGNWEFWERFDKAYISCCRKMIVYRLPGWEVSKGVQAEIKIAQEMGIPIEYID